MKRSEMERRIADFLKANLGEVSPEVMASFILANMIEAGMLPPEATIKVRSSQYDEYDGDLMFDETTEIKTHEWEPEDIK
jgi:hypothetical protein